MDAKEQTIPQETVPSEINAKPTTSAKDQGGFKPFGAERKFSRPRSESRFGGRPRSGFGRREEGARKDDMDSKLLDLSRVSHTRAGGRRLRFRAIVISGNKAGRVGLGVASGLDVAQAVDKATVQSKKNMITVPIIEGTISREVAAKVGPAKVIIKPQRKGRGLMAGGVVRLICQLAGIKDISSKMLGTTKNKLNNARATMKAFEHLKRQTGAKEPVAVVPKPEMKENTDAPETK
jgi:small subunit ribosomal protein S5